MWYQLLLLLLFFSTTLSAFEYRVEFQGVADRRITTSLKEVSDTLQLKTKKPITSYAWLRKRAEADLPKLQNVLKYYGFLDATCDFVIERGKNPACVFRIDPGKLYLITSIKTEPQLDLKSIDFHIPMPAE